MKLRHRPEPRPDDCPRCEKRPANKGTGYCWPCTLLLGNIAARAYDVVRARDPKASVKDHIETLVREAVNEARLMESALVAEVERDG